MSSQLGFSVYVSTFPEQKKFLKKLEGKEYFVFTSFHVPEEITPNYSDKIIEMCQWLKEHKFSIIADISPKTITEFDVQSLEDLINIISVDYLRLDYGFSKEEYNRLESNHQIVYNASTAIRDTINYGSIYMHNFYPRPETGLDEYYFSALNTKIREKGGEILAFIASDSMRRGPLHQGLPTLEKHRNLLPYVQYLDLYKTFKVEHIFLGDLEMELNNLELITSYQKHEVILIPVKLDSNYKYLLDQEFTVRIDSPKSLIRVKESREMDHYERRISPKNNFNRAKGSITIDNEQMKRYEGEVQIMCEDYPSHIGVNVIGQVLPQYQYLLNIIERGDKFKFVM